MHHPLVSVITPCYNDGKYILDTVKSVEKSTYDNIEHIIINDGSTDQCTLKVLEGINNPRVRIIHTENQGVCSARNTGVIQSNGKYLLLLDSDDLISAEYIARSVEQLEADDKVALVTCNYRLFGKDYRSKKVEKYSMEKLLGHNLFIVSSFCRRRDFDRVGGFSEKMFIGLEDWDFWLSILALGGRVVILDDELFFYRQKSTHLSRNASTNRDSNFEQLRRLLWEKHKELYCRFYPDPLQTCEYLSVAKSMEYRIGKKLLSPIRKLISVYRSI